MIVGFDIEIFKAKNCGVLQFAKEGVHVFSPRLHYAHIRRKVTHNDAEIKKMDGRNINTPEDTVYGELDEELRFSQFSQK